MCQFCASLDKLMNPYKEFLNFHSEDFPELPEHTNIPSHDMKTSTMSMGINAQKMAEESISFSIPIKHYLRTFRITFLCEILRRVIEMTPEEVKNKLHDAVKEDMVKYIARSLLEDGVTEIPDMTGLNHHSIPELAQVKVVALVPILESEAAPDSEANKPVSIPHEEKSNKKFMELLESMEVDDATRKH